MLPSKATSVFSLPGTAPKVQAIFRSALGGCLFLDEAYAIMGGDNHGPDPAASDAIRTLLTGGQGTAFPLCFHCRPSYRETMPFIVACPSKWSI